MQGFQTCSHQPVIRAGRACGFRILVCFDAQGFFRDSVASLPHYYHPNPVQETLNDGKNMADQVKEKLALLRTKLDQIPALQKAEVRMAVWML
jgi:hypothetical protein